MDEVNWVPVVVAAIGSGGIGAAARELITMIKLSREGVSGREDKRRADILGERDYALTQLEIERRRNLLLHQRNDIERENRRRAMEAYINLRMWHALNSPQAPLPEFPDFEDTTPSE